MDMGPDALTVVIAVDPPLLATALARALTIGRLGSVVALEARAPTGEVTATATMATVGVVGPARQAEVVATALIVLCPPDQRACWVRLRGATRVVRLEGLESLEDLVCVTLKEVAAEPLRSSPHAEPRQPPPAGWTLQAS